MGIGNAAISTPATGGIITTGSFNSGAFNLCFNGGDANSGFLNSGLTNTGFAIILSTRAALIAGTLKHQP